jgi:hypothetical protein
MTRPAVTLLVFGRGVTVHDGRFGLGPDGAARVRAAVRYVTERRAAYAGDRPRVVFTGGWARRATADPPAGCREGDLMLAAARIAGLDRYADLHAETRSRSTLENVLHSAEEGLLGDRTFTVTHPLGVVTHRWHLPRVRYLVGRVLAVAADAVLGIPVTAADGALDRRPWWIDPTLHAGSRLCFLGATDPAALRRRERLIAAMAGRRPRRAGR